MITVSLIIEYLYCPFKVYIQQINDFDILTNQMISGRMSHEALRGYEEIIKRNLWSLKKDMDINEILKVLFKDVPEFLDDIYHQYHDELINGHVEIIFESLKEDIKFSSLIIAIKSQKILKTGRTCADVVDLLFPPCLIEFTIVDQEIGLIGKIDKIEIVDGVYYPIKIKTGLPPLKGVWESDALQVTAYAILMEREFNKEVPVGFINYMRVGTKKPVLINSYLREKFSKVYYELDSLINNGSVPEIVQNVRKCRACDYYELCDYSIE
jgi:CRISPR-associated exonuclease Cas4